MGFGDVEAGCEVGETNIGSNPVCASSVAPSPFAASVSAASSETPRLV